MKTLHMNQTVYEATQKYPELIDIIASWGFPQIKNAYLRRTIGSRFTINQAIKELHLNKTQVLNSLKSNGFEVI